MQKTSRMSPLVFCIQLFPSSSPRLLYSRALRAEDAEDKRVSPLVFCIQLLSSRHSRALRGGLENRAGPLCSSYPACHQGAGYS
ncbi:hypothetical protein GDO78_000842 [Eleutherodactylus coqui]|uniref:Uncharacterized protein n=1 Tax=Eleutherodactylus coqui TaxID=57060 RepID=A0A8J6KGX3_ELECQ|nr:hypothetical protein GDO78_000842 [Eleutherodactylus coqui]